MNRFLEILAVQRPFSIGVDENSRVVFSCNYSAMVANPVVSWETSLADYIDDILGLATKGVDLFIGPLVNFPENQDVFSLIINNGGPAPLEAHSGEKYHRLSIQIETRGIDYESVEAQASILYSAIDGTRNLTI